MNIQGLAQAAQRFRQDAEEILGYHEESIHRVATLQTSYAKLDKLNATQDDMLRQALRCIEVKVFRGAHVLAWASLADYLQRLAARDGFLAINSVREKWALKDLDDLRERIGEHNLIEAMKAAKLITKTEKKSMHSLLNKRNECAHPTDYFPDLNQTLGYVSECITRIETLIQKYG